MMQEILHALFAVAYIVLYFFLQVNIHVVIPIVITSSLLFVIRQRSNENIYCAYTCII